VSHAMCHSYCIPSTSRYVHCTEYRCGLLLQYSSTTPNCQLRSSGTATSLFKTKSQKVISMIRKSQVKRRKWTLQLGRCHLLPLGLLWILWVLWTRIHDVSSVKSSLEVELQLQLQMQKQMKKQMQMQMQIRKLPSHWALASVSSSQSGFLNTVSRSDNHQLPPPPTTVLQHRSSLTHRSESTETVSRTTDIWPSTTTQTRQAVNHETTRIASDMAATATSTAIASKPLIRDPSTVRVAYAIVITSCPLSTKPSHPIVDGPAVLAHSIRRLPTLYDYDLVALVLPEAVNCTQHLPSLGYKLIVRNLGFTLKSIKGYYDFRQYIQYDGCCGEKELLKLEVYTLRQYAVVVHLDTDLLILKSMDGIINAMLGIDPSNNIQVLHRDRALPAEINFLFTRDYIQMSRSTNDTSKFAVQGGFFAVKPSTPFYRKLIGEIRKGVFNVPKGWGLKGYGGYYGAPQVQGLLSYFYGELFPDGAVELNPCIYNSMVNFSPYTSDGRCRYNTTTDYCPDCLNMSLSELHSTHFTVCFKPWICPKQKRFGQLCKDTHRAWFQIRQELELKWNQTVPDAKPDAFNVNSTLGYCTGRTAAGYIPLRLPSSNVFG
jgi:hypothetical protein